MSKLEVTDFFIYRYRYLVSYFLIGLILFGLLFVSGTLVPGGLSQTEMDAATKSGNIALGVFAGNQPDNIPFLPYRLLQGASIELLGVSTLSIKLPSLILAAGSIILLFGILMLWFRRNVAIIITLITMTSSQFLLQSQSGTAGIVYMFWGALLVFAGSMMAHRKSFRPFWLIALGGIAGLSLYIPYMLYAIVPLAFTAIVHPHARFIVFKQPLWAILGASALFIITLIPMILATISEPVTLIHIAAGSAIATGTFSLSTTLPEFLKYIDFYNNHGGRILLPAYSMGLLALAIVGFVAMIRTKYTAKSYILTAWAILTIPILIINPDIASAAMLPITLLAAFAIDYLIRRWYTLFPRNPYARVAGLIPLGALVFVLSLSNMDRYIYGFHYDPNAASAYSTDTTLIQEEASNHKEGELSLVVPKNQQNYYEMLAARSSSLDLEVVTEFDSSTRPTTIVSGAVNDDIEEIPSHILVSALGSDANRFYVYENVE